MSKGEWMPLTTGAYILGAQIIIVGAQHPQEHWGIWGCLSNWAPVESEPMSPMMDIRYKFLYSEG